jgi:hypothetical protein
MPVQKTQPDIQPVVVVEQPKATEQQISPSTTSLRKIPFVLLFSENLNGVNPEVIKFIPGPSYITRIIAQGNHITTVTPLTDGLFFIDHIGATGFLAAQIRAGGYISLGNIFWDWEFNEPIEFDSGACTLYNTSTGTGYVTITIYGFYFV